MDGEGVTLLLEEEAEEVEEGEQVQETEGQQRLREVSSLVDEGIDYLKQALALRPDYVDAMQYLNLLYREKAKLTQDEEEKRGWEGEADKLALSALELKRKTRSRGRRGPAQGS